jgi:hypothetical protein
MLRRGTPRPRRTTEHHHRALSTRTKGRDSLPSTGRRRMRNRSNTTPGMGDTLRRCRDSQRHHTADARPAHGSVVGTRQNGRLPQGHRERHSLSRRRGRRSPNHRAVRRRATGRGLPQSLRLHVRSTMPHSHRTPNHHDTHDHAPRRDTQPRTHRHRRRRQPIHPSHTTNRRGQRSTRSTHRPHSYGDPARGSDIQPDMDRPTRTSRTYHHNNTPNMPSRRSRSM